MDKIASHEYCRNFVRQQDYHLYLLHFFAPKKKRRTILGLMALHCELKLIPLKTVEPHMRYIRLQWWQDEIEKIMDNAPTAESPILQEITLCKKSRQSINHYFDSFETDAHEDRLFEVFYDVLDHDESFFKKVAHHRKLGATPQLRALRLWLGI
jgi:hypothetical protein